LDDHDIMPLDCTSGYGNPSGHALTTGSCYYALYHLTYDVGFLKDYKCLQIGYFIFLFLLSLSVMFSRMWLGLHTLNELIYGHTLGLAIYFYFFVLLELHKTNYLDFFNNFQILWKCIVYYTTYIGCLLALMLVYTIKFFDNSAIEDYYFLICPYPGKNNWDNFQDDGLGDGLIILTLIGFHISIHILTILINTYYSEKKDIFYLCFNQFTYTEFKLSIYRLLFLAIISAPPAIPLMAISGDANKNIVFIFKIGLPYLFTTMIPGVGIFFADKLGLTFHPENNISQSEIDLESVKGKVNDTKNYGVIENVEDVQTKNFQSINIK